MGLLVLEIKTIPQYQLLSPTIEGAMRSTSAVFRDLLSYLSSMSFAESSVFELIFHKSQTDLPRMFITVRNDEQIQSMQTEGVFSAISNYLTNAHFSVQVLEGEAFSSVVRELRQQFSKRIVAMTKGEKLITSNISYSGYYYYTDYLDFPVDGRTEAYNYDSLFSQMLACRNVTIAFQLIPTQFTQEEYYALSSLSSELSSAVQGFFMERQMVRETAAEAPRKTYTYYTERATQPLFIGNILIASDNDTVDGIVATLKGGIQQSLANPISLTALELNDCSALSYDFFHLPWNIYNQLLLNYRDQRIWNGTVFQPTNLMRLPFLYTAEEATVFFRLPIDDGKIQGIHSNRVANDNEIISDKVLAAGNIQFGKLLDSSSTIGARQEDFTRHALVVGTPGSGKTTFAINLLLQFHEKGVPFLAIEPTKTEYRALKDKIPDLQVFTPGNSSIVPFIINPFIPPKGIRLEQYIPSLMSAFRAAFSMESPLDAIFLNAIRRCYAQYGWKNGSTSSDPGVQPFGLFEFVLEFKKVIASSDYKQETRNHINTAGTFRLVNLLDQNKYIYDTIHTIPIEELLDRPTVIELNAIADDEQKALLMALVLIAVCLYTKNKGSSAGGINNILMIDEAHVLLGGASRSDGQAKAQTATVQSLQKMIAEIRSFGTGIIIADQAPSKVTTDIVANTDLKIAFRLVEQSERNLIANSTNMSDQQSAHLARMKRGEAIAYYSALESPKIILTPDVRAENNIRFQIPDEEVRASDMFWDRNQRLLVPFYECRFCPQCRMNGACDRAVRERADYYASHLLYSVETKITTREILEKFISRLHEPVIRFEAKEFTRMPLKMVCNCTKVHFIRNALLNCNFSLNRAEIATMLKHYSIKEAS